VLDIIVLVLCGRHIASIAKRKNRNPVGYVLLLVFGWIGLEVLGGITGIILAEVTGAREDEAMLFIVPLAIMGALSGLGLAYLVVCSVAPLKRRRRTYDDYDDYDDAPRSDRRDRDDEYDRHRASRREVEYDEYDDRRRRRHMDELD
jgi:hypothetical protein